MLEKFILILLFIFQKISPIWIFDSNRSYRNNRYNWAECRLRASSFISRFLEAEEQINAPTSMREVGGRFALETIAVIKDAPDYDLRFRSASKKFVGQSQKCEPVCLPRNNNAEIWLSIHIGCVIYGNPLYLGEPDGVCRSSHTHALLDVARRRK